jgi:hypothetical protein
MIPDDLIVYIAIIVSIGVGAIMVVLAALMLEWIISK